MEVAGQTVDFGHHQSRADRLGMFHRGGELRSV